MIKHLLIGLLLCSQSAWSDPTLSPVQVYKRCYIRMTRMLPSDTDPLYLKVKDGSLTSVDACIALFDRAQFTTDGVLKNRNNDEAKAIVKTFNDLHRSWFQDRAPAVQRPSNLVRDIEEPALYFTRAAFLPNTPFSSVLTLNTGLSGVRDQQSYPDEEKDFVAQRVARAPASSSYATDTDLIVAYSDSTINSKDKIVSNGIKALKIPNGQVTEVGALVGVKPSASLTLPAFRFPGSSDPAGVTAIRSILYNLDANKHFGGGIIGSQGFFLNNANLLVNTLPFEYAAINRRLTSRVYEDLLCHQLPSLLDEDVTTEVDEKSEFAFHQSTSCMRCHSSIDGMAYGYRNLFIYDSSPNTNSQDVGFEINGVASFKPSATSTFFAAQPPKGRMHYRELLTATRRDADFSSLAELGEKLSTGQDLYTCAAKRYYKFFTGVDVSLTEKADTSLDKLHQNKVLSLAKAFKTSQNVRSLLFQIFSSDAFNAPNYLTERAK